MLFMTFCRIINMFFLMKGIYKHPAKKEKAFKALQAPFQRLVLKRQLGLLYHVLYAISC
jgi:hypothetical protein